MKYLLTVQMLPPFLLCLLVLSSCGGRKHPLPESETIDFVISPLSRNIVAQIVTVKWSDGIYRDSPAVRFKDEDNNTWIISCYGHRPEDCRVYLVLADQSDEKVMQLERLNFPFHHVLAVPHEERLSITTGQSIKTRFLGFDELNVMYQFLPDAHVD